MRVLVIGGTRFIGPAVVRRLRALGHDVMLFHRGQHEADLPRDVAHVHGERERLEKSTGKFRRFRPDVAVDMAAYTENDALSLRAALRGIARRLVVLSSQDVYGAYDRFHRVQAGPLHVTPFAEDAPLRERLYPYRDSGRGLDFYEKILVERTIMAGGVLPATILRLPMVYGERDYQRRLFIELRRMDDGRPAILLEETFAQWRWTRAYVEDVAAAVILAATDYRAAGRVYNVGEPDALTYADWLHAIGRAAGWQGEIVVVPDGRLPPQLRPPDADYAQHLIADTNRVRLELGYQETVPRDEALRRAVEWERARRAEDPPPALDYALEDALLRELGKAPATEGAPAVDEPLGRSDPIS